MVLAPLSVSVPVPFLIRVPVEPLLIPPISILAVVLNVRLSLLPRRKLPNCSVYPFPPVTLNVVVVLTVLPIIQVAAVFPNCRVNPLPLES